MSTYQYKARDRFGRKIASIMSADSENAVATKLAQSGYTPIQIKEVAERKRTTDIFARFRKVKFADLNVFTRQLAVLQRAGLPILLSLKAIEDQAENPVLKDAIVYIIRDIGAGSSLSDALSRHPRAFNTLYVNAVRAGETSGTLDNVLERLASMGEHDEQIRLRIKSATRYPLFVVIAIIIGFFVLTTFVIPRFANVYSQFSVALPLPTRILLGINKAVVNYWWLLLILIFGSIYGFVSFINTKKGRVWWDNLKLKTPIIGPIVLKLTMSRFARITGTLLRSGVPVLDIMDLASKGTGNVIISRIIENIGASVKEGKGMAEPMKLSGAFPPVVVQMVAVGEETGKLDELLLYVADYYNSQVDFTIKNLTSLIEPILIFILGLGVLFMALGIFLPMWNLMSLFKG